MEKKADKKITFHIKDENKNGVYANAVSVNVKNNDVILDFGYIIPGIKPTAIDIVSRINLSHQTAEQFLSILQDSILNYRIKTKSKKK